MRIALDAMGGDNAPAVIVQGALEAARNYDVEVLLVGDEQTVNGELAKHNPVKPNISIVHAGEVVKMGASPTVALKRKNTSIAVAIALLSEGKADALVTAGDTGAAMALAFFTLGNLSGVRRPAIAVPIPTRSSICILIDGGANMSCKPTNLLQFAIMGKVYAEKILQRREPKVGLLNVGEEEGKGNKLAKEAYKMLSGTPLNFVGNIEGKDMFNSDVDVVVCDGFTGNVSMKIVEGLAEALFSLLENSEKATLIETIKRKFDYSEYGGAPLLGINGTCIISHGRSSKNAIKNAICVASELVSLEVNHSIQEEIQQYGPLYRFRRGLP